jgi:hypothetical protein
MLAKRFTTYQSRKPRVEGQHKIHLRIASVEQGLAAETLNIALGGMAVREIPQGAQVGDSIDFEIELSPMVGKTNESEVRDPLVNKMNEATNPGTAVVTHMRGSGRIAWISRAGSMGDSIGIAFEHLGPNSVRVLETYLQRHFESLRAGPPRL